VLLLRLLAIALPLSFAWEMLQMPAFVGLPDDVSTATGVCALAAAADALIVLALWRFGAWMFDDPRWFAPTALRRYIVIVLAGVTIHGALEWMSVARLALWTYRDVQPTIPGLRIGILPVLQPVVLLPHTFWLLGQWLRYRA
jgi:hypothetical protein